jgi:hypothetical protein
MSDLAKAVLHLPSRFAMLSEGTNSRVELKDGSWAVAYGLTIWGFTQGSGFESQEGGGARDALQAAWRWFKKFLP